MKDPYLNKGELLMAEKKNQKIIALCMAGLRAEYHDVIINSICQYAQNVGYKVLTFTSCTELVLSATHDVGEENIFNLMNFDIIDGLVVLSETIKNSDALMRIVNKGLQSGTPVVSIEKEIDGCYNVVFDYDDTITRMVKHFVEHHKFSKINFMAGYRGNEYSEERLNAYKRVMAEYGLPVEDYQISYGDFWATPTYAVMDEYFRNGYEIPQAFICANDDMAIAVCEKLNDYGYSVPEDVCVSGVDGIREGQYHWPQITTAHQNLDVMAEIVINKLRAVFEGEIVEASTEKVKNDLIFSQSCGCREKSFVASNKYIREMSACMADFNNFNTHMTRMVSHLSEGISFDECVKKLENYLHFINHDNVWLCMVDNYITDVSAFEEVFSVKDRYKAGYSSEMDVVTYKKGRKFNHIDSFESKNILPSLEKLLKEYNHIMFLPLHFQDMAIGYAAVEMEAPVTDLNKVYSFFMNVSNILETIKNHTEMKMIISRLEEMYVHDPLTGLFNRRGFYNYVNRIFNKCKHEKKKMIIISLDLDGLKSINDIYGHSEGDKAIKALAMSLMASSVHNEVCARFGGDEFIIASIADEEDESRDYINQYVGRIQRYLSNYNKNSGNPYDVRASYGIVKQVPDEEMTLDGLIKIADELMYNDKFKNKKYREKLRERI